MPRRHDEDVVDLMRPPRIPIRQLVTCVDLVAVLIGWAVTFSMALAIGNPHTGVRIILAQTGMVLGAGILLLSANGLYRRRLCAVRSAEIARIGSTSVALAATAAVVLASTGRETALTAAAVGGLTWFALLTMERGFFRDWIQVRRCGGGFRAPVVVVGAGSTSTLALASLLDRHLLLGFDVRGVVCPAGTPTHEAAEEVDLRWLGPPGDLVEQARRSGASGLVVDAGSLTGDEVSDVVQQLAPTGLNLHLSSGLRGIDNREVSVAPLDDETLLHVAPLGLSRRQRTMKRTVDLVVGSLLLVLVSPVLLIAAAAIRAHDRGPVLSRQKRIGLDGEPFELYKLRTRTLDVPQRPGDEPGNSPSASPRTSTADPSLTPIGRFLQASGIDELLKLCNVLEGTMSLVGPRPAPPATVAPFDKQANTWLTVKPGMTGLWRVEARDMAGYDVHRRLDLVYVRTWSLALDLTILVRSLTVVASRSLPAFLPTSWRSDVQVRN